MDPPVRARRVRHEPLPDDRHQRSHRLRHARDRPGAQPEPVPVRAPDGDRGAARPGSVAGGGGAGPGVQPLAGVLDGHRSGHAALDPGRGAPGLPHGLRRVRRAHGHRRGISGPSHHRVQPVRERDGRKPRHGQHGGHPAGALHHRHPADPVLGGGAEALRHEPAPADPARSPPARHAVALFELCLPRGRPVADPGGRGDRDLVLREPGTGAVPELQPGELPGGPLQRPARHCQQLHTLHGLHAAGRPPGDADRLSGGAPALRHHGGAGLLRDGALCDPGDRDRRGLHRGLQQAAHRPHRHVPDPARRLFHPASAVLGAGGVRHPPPDRPGGGGGLDQPGRLAAQELRQGHGPPDDARDRLGRDPDLGADHHGDQRHHLSLFRRLVHDHRRHLSAGQQQQLRQRRRGVHPPSGGGLHPRPGW